MAVLVFSGIFIALVVYSCIRYMISVVVNVFSGNFGICSVIHDLISCVVWLLEWAEWFGVCSKSDEF